MTQDILYIAAGLVILVLAGDALVRGAVALSLKLGLSALIVALTIVAFGTSAPEMLVGVKATLGGATGIVYGNVVGSNIANVLLVLGVPLLIAPIATNQHGGRRNLVMMLATTCLFFAIAANGGMTTWIGAAFLVLLFSLIFDAYVMAAKDPSIVDYSEVEDAPVTAPGWKIATMIVVGIIGLPIGAQFLVDGARNVALDLGVSEAAIGLTVVAIGTSLPELATTVMAALRRHADVAVGNVVGSNLFNVLGVMGVSALFGDLPTPEGFLEFDFWIMLAASLALVPYIFLQRSMTWITGCAFLAAYAAYIVFALGPRM